MLWRLLIEWCSRGNAGNVVEVIDCVHEGMLGMLWRLLIVCVHEGMLGML